jgi:response regulator RpfG family c-di-GMP phosphodiesterase
MNKYPKEKNGLKIPSETILLFGLSPAEKDLIKRLISSFEIETVDLSLATIGTFAQKFPEKKPCLIVYHIDEYQKQQNYIIRVIRAFVGNRIPFLVLVPRQKSDEIEKYLKAGVDDYMELPVNENRFSIGFLVLLELGQAIVRPPNELPNNQGIRLE